QTPVGRSARATVRRYPHGLASARRPIRFRIERPLEQPTREAHFVGLRCARRLEPLARVGSMPRRTLHVVRSVASASACQVEMTAMNRDGVKSRRCGVDLGLLLGFPEDAFCLVDAVLVGEERSEPGAQLALMIGVADLLQAAECILVESTCRPSLT